MVRVEVLGAHGLRVHGVIPQDYPFTFFFGASLLKLNGRKKGTLMFKGLLRNRD